MKPGQLMQLDQDGREVLRPGRYALLVGGCSPGACGLALGAPEMARVELEVV